MAMMSSIAFGAADIDPPTVLDALFNFDPTSTNHLIIRTLRVPRAAVAVLVGAALAVAGAVMQGLTRNPLASPDIIGISAGAGLVAVTLIVVVQTVPAGVLPAAAFAGALVVAGLIYILAWRKGDSPIRMILIGVGLQAIASAATTLMITFGDIYDVQRALIWLTGSVYARSWTELNALLPWLLVFLPLALLLARHLNILNLGEELARGLGSRVEWQRGLLLLAAVALAGATVAAAGTIGFVGLMSPHFARRLVGPLHDGLLPTAGLIGGLIVVAADLVGRTLFAPIELPCGLITAAIGAPFFVYLLYQQRNR
jgi:iron complex transport system permease protein